MRWWCLRKNAESQANKIFTIHEAKIWALGLHQWYRVTSLLASAKRSRIELMKLPIHAARSNVSMRLYSLESGTSIGPVLLVMFRLVLAYFSLFSLTEHYWISRNQPTSRLFHQPNQPIRINLPLLRAPQTVVPLFGRWSQDSYAARPLLVTIWIREDVKIQVIVHGGVLGLTTEYGKEGRKNRLHHVGSVIHNSQSFSHRLRCSFQSHSNPLPLHVQKKKKSPSPSLHTRTQAPKNASPIGFGSFSMGHRAS
jgi:hypothetical protein